MATKKATYGKVAPKAAKGTGLRAAQNYLGLVQNAQGAWVRPNAKQASGLLAKMAGNLGYQTDPAYPASTPFANQRGQRLGTFEQSTGIFTLAGRAPGAGPARGVKTQTRKRRGGAAGKGLNEPLERVAEPYAESDLATTAYVRTQGKAYAAGRAAGQSLAGQTGAAGKKPAAKKKGRVKKGLLKTRGHRQQSGVKPAFHISKSGKVVPNKGGRKARPKTK